MPRRSARARERDGDEYVLNGRKQWCTNGGYAAVVMAMFRTGGDGARGISAFLVDTALPGVTVERVTEKLGIHTSNTVDLALTDVRVPAARCSATRARASSSALATLPPGASASPRRRPASSRPVSTRR